MFKNLLKKLPALLLCITILSAQTVSAVFSDGALREIDGNTPATNTVNAFYGALVGGCGGISLQDDYGSDSLSVALIDRKQDKFIIELNGNTLTLGYLALNMSLEVRGEGTLRVLGGIVIYAGELYLGDGVQVVSDAPIPIIAHSSYARIRIGEDVTVQGQNATAEFGIRYEYKDAPIVFEKLPEPPADSDGVWGIHRFRVIYESCSGEIPEVSTASVARFPSEEDALSALERGFISVINPMEGTDTESTDDDSFLKVMDNTVTVGKSGAVLSHANLSLDGALGVNLYFELSGLEGSVESLGALIYSGVGEGGILPLPEKNADGKYQFRIPITPMDMNKTITVRFAGDESGKSWDYSVVKYARYILSDTENVFGTAIKDLIASMLNYGAVMQSFSGETEDLANEVLAEFPQYDSAEEISAKVSEAVSWLKASGYAYEDTFYAEGSDVSFDHMTLAVNEITAIRIYSAEGFPTDGRYSYQLSYHNTLLDGSVYEKTELIPPESIAEYGYIEISGIPAGNFHRVFRITARKDGKVVAYCETTVFNYVMKLYERSAEGSVERTLAEALIWYGARNVSYFGGA